MTSNNNKNIKSNSSYTCLPKGFKFQSYEPLDPSIPSTSSSSDVAEPPQLVKQALLNFPTFQHHVHPSEKEPVKTAVDAKKVLTKGRVENRANADLESTIQDQRVKADAAVEEAIKVIGGGKNH